VDAAAARGRARRGWGGSSRAFPTLAGFQARPPRGGAPLFPGGSGRVPGRRGAHVHARDVAEADGAEDGVDKVEGDHVPGNGSKGFQHVSPFIWLKGFPACQPLHMAQRVSSMSAPSYENARYISVWYVLVERRGLRAFRVPAPGRAGRSGRAAAGRRAAGRRGETPLLHPTVAWRFAHACSTFPRRVVSQGSFLNQSPLINPEEASLTNTPRRGVSFTAKTDSPWWNTAA
jgi:hypothetical protein